MKSIFEAIGIVTIITIFGVAIIILAGLIDANSNAVKISDFEYNNSHYHMYLDTDMTYDNKLKMRLFRGVFRTDEHTLKISNEVTADEVILLFKAHMGAEISKDSLLNDWQSKQIKVIERLKSGN
jgi:hypothetical protein